MRALVRLVASVVVAVSVLVATAPHATGQFFFTGNTLMENCRAGVQDKVANLIDFGACTGYILAVTDVLAANKGVCLHAGVTMAQIRDFVVKWLEANPQKRHLAAHGLVAQAMSEAFPCKN